MAVDMPNERSTRVIAVAMKEDISMYQALELAGKAVAHAMHVNLSSIARRRVDLADFREGQFREPRVRANDGGWRLCVISGQTLPKGAILEPFAPW